jgi:hypothetical protein
VSLESVHDGPFRRSSGMNGISLPSEVLFNHAHLFRRLEHWTKIGPWKQVD